MFEEGEDDDVEANANYEKVNKVAFDDYYSGGNRGMQQYRPHRPNDYSKKMVELFV